MTRFAPPFPDRLRQRVVRRRRRWPVALILVPCLLLPLPWWRIEAVYVETCPGIPQQARLSLESLVGTCPLSLDLDWVRDQLEVWPGVAAVDVHLELPGAMHVSAMPVVACGSVRVGDGWHAVASDGVLGASLETSMNPVLEGFGCLAPALRSALAVADRLQRATGATVLSIKRVMPGDLEVRIQTTSGGESTMRVGLVPTRSEKTWCALAKAGAAGGGWVDLRVDGRMVIGARLEEGV